MLNKNDLTTATWPVACKKAQEGATIYRESWNGKGIWCRVQFPDSGSKMSSPYFYIDTTGLRNNDHVDAKRSCCPWVPSQTDMFAHDWVVTDVWRTNLVDGSRLGTLWDSGMPVVYELVSGKTRTTVPTDLQTLRQQLLYLPNEYHDTPVLVVSDDKERWEQLLHGIDIVVTDQHSRIRGIGYTRFVVDLPCLTPLLAATLYGPSTLTRGATIFMVLP